MSEQQIFLNRQVSLEGLPQVERLMYTPLRRQYQTLRLLATVISTGVMLVGSGIALAIVSVPVWVPFAAVGFWLLVMIISLVFVVKGFPHMGYAIRQRDIVYKQGWLYKRQITIPFTRIQHVDVRQGVMERWYNLGKLNIYTAGGQGSDLSIPGLDFEEAQRIRSFILGKVTSDEEE